MRRVLLVVIAAVVAVVPAGAEEPTGAEETTWAPNLVTEQVWFACGEQKLENADNNVATWDTEAPTESVTAGAGCGTVDLPFMQTAPGNIYDATWTGYFTGNLDTLNVELHDIYVGPGRATGDLNVAIKVFIDGTPVFGDLGHEVALKPVRSSTGLSEMVKFSIVNLGYISEAENIEHEVSLVMQTGTARNRGPTVTDTVSGWVWDTTEVPSGLTFNPPTLNELVIDAAPPAP